MSMDQPPTSPRTPGARSRGFSFRSDKSGGSRGKVDLTESPEDKARRDSIWKTTSKANPNAAITEAQPGVRNLTEQSTLGSLRDGAHKDVHGNTIVDPDLSNPTRPRLERPLDTIRSFEKAIDNGYKRRSSYMRSESYDQQNQYNSRRSSYFGGKYMSPDGSDRRRSMANVLNAGYDGRPSPGRHSAMGGGYYGERRPESYYGPNGPPNGPPRQRYSNRMQSDSHLPYNGQQRPYGQHEYHQSMDTMQTALTNGSDSTGLWANSTDPSSENSSIDKNMAGRAPQESYGQQQNGYGYGSPPIMEEGGAAYGGPVRPPNAARRAPIPLGNSGDAPPPPGKLPTAARPEPEKKKGRLSRMFSKKGKD